MPEYLKETRRKVSEAIDRGAEKVKEAGRAAVKMATGSDGKLGEAKAAIKSREAKLNEAEGMKHGGKVGRKKR